jgi:hypothetical protein
MTESTRAVPSIMNVRIDVLSLGYIHAFLRAFTRSVRREIDDWDILMSRNRGEWSWCETLSGTPPCSLTQRVRSGRRFWEESVCSNDIMFSQSLHFCANWKDKPFNQTIWREWNLGFDLVSTGLRTNFKESLRKWFANRNQSRRSEICQTLQPIRYYVIWCASIFTLTIFLTQTCKYFKTDIGWIILSWIRQLQMLWFPK